MMSQATWELLYRFAVLERDEAKFLTKAEAAKAVIDQHLRERKFQDEDEKVVLKAARANLDSLLYSPTSSPITLPPAKIAISIVARRSSGSRAALSCSRGFLVVRDSNEMTVECHRSIDERSLTAGEYSIRITAYAHEAVKPPRTV